MSDTHPRYIVAPDRLAEPPAYAVVDTQGDNGANPEILCATTDAFASRIAEALNAPKVEQLAKELQTARDALVEVHQFIRHQLDPNAPEGTRWSSYHAGAGLGAYVEELQREFDDPAVTPKGTDREEGR